MKNGANVVNLNEYKPVGTHWIPLETVEHSLLVSMPTTFQKKSRDLLATAIS